MEISLPWIIFWADMLPFSHFFPLSCIRELKKYTIYSNMKLGTGSDFDISWSQSYGPARIVHCHKVEWMREFSCSHFIWLLVMHTKLLFIFQNQDFLVCQWLGSKGHESFNQKVPVIHLGLAHSWDILCCSCYSTGDNLSEGNTWRDHSVEIKQNTHLMCIYVNHNMLISVFLLSTYSVHKQVYENFFANW